MTSDQFTSVIIGLALMLFFTGVQATGLAVQQEQATDHPSTDKLPALTEPSLVPQASILPTPQPALPEAYPVVKNQPPAGPRAKPGITHTNTLGMKLTGIPPGEFFMGSHESPNQVASAFTKEEANSFLNEHPLRLAKINQGFFLGTTEVTVAQFRSFVDATGYKTQVEKGEMGVAATEVEFEKSATWRSPLGLKTKTNDQHPVAVITYNDAVAFCQWLSRKEGKTYRLPTDAEWEYATRAGTTTRYWNGNDPHKLTEIANIPDASHRALLNSTDKSDSESGTLGSTFTNADDGFALFAPVGSYQANPWGLYDVHGNVWEWCTVTDFGNLKIDKSGTKNIAVIRGGCFY